MPPRPEPEQNHRTLPAWPERLIQLARVVGDGNDPAAAETALAPLWRLVNSVLRQNIRSQSRRLGPVSAEDLEDLAATKSLELLQRLDEKTWSPTTSSPAEVVAFLSAVARNALVDHLRRSGRRPMVPVDTLDDEALGHAEFQGSVTSPDEGFDRERFVDALRGCAGKLQPKHRTIWFFRVFYELPTKRIACHPEVGLKPGHVDVILQRCRTTIRDCMRAKGLVLDEIPPGAFAAMWETFRLDEFPAPDGESRG